MIPERIDQFPTNPLLARIATVDPETRQPHVVPVWYTWKDGSLWISSFHGGQGGANLVHHAVRCSRAVWEMLCE